VAAVTARFAARRTTRSARATQALGTRLGALLRPGDVVALVGELGAGKTQLVRGACAGAAVPAREVSSPSFAIVATYRGRLPVHHADLYRIGDEDELYGTGFGDLVGGDGALLVEWADRIPGALPEEKLTLRLSHDARAPNARHVELEGVGERAVELARLLAGARSGSRSGSGSGSGSRSGSRSKSKSKSKSKPRSKPRSPATSKAKPRGRSRK
jgi:tRNA threonylcarbamoyladenosine biosynthesis protein TsaE